MDKENNKNSSATIGDGILPFQAKNLNEEACGMEMITTSPSQNESESLALTADSLVMTDSQATIKIESAKPRQSVDISHLSRATASSKQKFNVRKQLFPKPNTQVSQHSKMRELE